MPAATPNRPLPSAWRHVLFNWTGFLLSSLIALFLSPFVVHHLGNTAYGIWILIASLTGYLGLMNQGIGTAVTRYMAQFHAEGEDSEASATASSAMAMCLVAGAFVVLISLILPAILLRQFHIPEAYRLTAQIILILAGFNIAASLLAGVFSGTLTALHRFDLFNLIGVVNSAGSAIAFVLVLDARGGLISIALVSLSFGVGAGLMYMVAVSRVYPTLQIRFAKCDTRHVKLICSVSVYALLLQLSFNLIFYTDSIVIGAFLSVGLITCFAIAGNLMNYSRALIGGISALMIPRASALGFRQRPKEVELLLLKATRLATVVIMPIALTFLLRGRSFIRLWMGAEYVGLSFKVLWILTLALIFIAGEQVATSLMIGLGKHRPIVIIVCCEATCNLILSIVLVHSMGITGVAWATTIPSLIVSVMFWPWYVKYCLGTPISSYVVSTWLRPIGAAVPFGLLSWGCERFWAPSNLVTFVVQTGLLLPAAAVGSWYCCFNGAERAAYAQKCVQPMMRILGMHLASTNPEKA